MEETLIMEPKSAAVSLLTEEQTKHLDDLMCSYNEKILEPLLKSYNRRQRYTNRLTQLFLQYRVSGSPTFVRVTTYLTTHDKLLDDRVITVIDHVHPSEPFDKAAVHAALRSTMVNIMRNGLGYLIRRSKKLPDELI